MKVMGAHNDAFTPSVHALYTFVVFLGRVWLALARQELVDH